MLSGSVKSASMFLNQRSRLLCQCVSCDSQSDLESATSRPAGGLTLDFTCTHPVIGFLFIVQTCLSSHLVLLADFVDQSLKIAFLFCDTVLIVL